MHYVGIDLGTTTSEIAIYKNDKPHTIIDRQGIDIIPSVVAIDERSKNLIFSKIAKEKYASDSQVVREIKREMGKDIKVTLGDQHYSPQEISALILKYLKKTAEEHFGEEVKKAVITVPANFNDKQRKATLEAGEIAGLEVLRIINEPTAAALAYGYSKGFTEEAVMVYDLGGGTFDVSIVEYMGDCVDVLSSAGDVELGGKDFDKVLTEHVVKVFEEINSLTLDKHSKEYRRLELACEEAKKELSFKESVSIFLPFFTVKNSKPVDLEVEVLRNAFERLLNPFIERTERAIKIALKDSGKTKEEINRVLLVGGSTRMPIIKKSIERIMGKKASTDIEPDRAVALGAVIQAAIIEGKSNKIIMDVTPLSFGTVTAINMGGVLIPGNYAEIMPPNSKYLLPKNDTFITLYDYQEEINFRVYQRDSLSNSEWAEIEGKPNEEDGFTLLDSRTIKGIPPKKAGDESLKVQYCYNPNGLIDVEITIISINKKICFQVSSQINRDNIENSLNKVSKTWEESAYIDKVRSTMYAAESKLQEDLNEKDSNRLKKIVNGMKSALEQNDLKLIEKIDDELTDFLFNLE